jgi:hypothetical protein
VAGFLVSQGDDMRIWLIYLQNRWRGIAAGGVAILALVALALLGWGGPALGMRLLGNADAPRVVTNNASGTVLPRSGDPNSSPEALTDANASVLDIPAPASAGPQTVAEAQAAWSPDMLQQREASLLTAINCARQARQLPALTLDAQLNKTAGAAWLRLMHEPAFSLMQLPGTYTLRSVLPVEAHAPDATSAAEQDRSTTGAAAACAADGFDATTLPLTGGARRIGIAVFPPQASWDMASAVILVQ